MNNFSKNPVLSVIIPVVNEAGQIPGLLFNLANQQGVIMEVIVSDGGSTDDTLERVAVAAKVCSCPVMIVRGDRGRGRQMNAAAAVCKGEMLLFLHADSLFADKFALRKALDALEAAMQTSGHQRVAGHFALRFQEEGSIPAKSFYFNECKARLNRRGCTHGDQGFLLHRSFFAEAGPFTETLPMFEDTRLAEVVRKAGKWLLLPAEIYTSTRRFEAEGFAERQLLNAIMMALAAIGREDFLLEMPSIYSCQNSARRLQLLPFINRIRGMVKALALRQRLAFWFSVGSYVLDNAWQPAFGLDVRRSFRCGIPAGEAAPLCLERFDRYLKPLINHTPGRIVTAVLVWVWFRLLAVSRRIAER
jgi:rSAM/selenodomain-associated transferase 2